MTSVPQTGQVLETRRQFSQADFDAFARLSGDHNPIHVDPAFSARTKFGKTVAHGMLLYSAVCGALGSHFAGLTPIQVWQDLMFPHPTFTGEEVIIRLQISSVQPDQGLAEMATEVVQPGGDQGLRGQTLVLWQSDSRAKPSHSNAASHSLPARLTGAAQSALVGAGSTASTGGVNDQALRGLMVGQRAVVRRAFTASDIAPYAELAHDRNPIYRDPACARGLGMADTPIPGPLLGGLFSCLLGTELPGPGTNYLKQRLVFCGLAYPGQEITAMVEIERIRPLKQLVTLSTTCVDDAGNTICRGQALVLVSDTSSQA